MKYKSLIKAKTIFLGLQILRMFFSYSIVYYHGLSKRVCGYKYYNNVAEVVAVGLTTFFIMAFYFSYDSFMSKNINKIKDRFKRLLIPYILWPVIMYIEKAIYYYRHGKKIKLFRLLIYQILIGNGLSMILWFNWNLIFVLLFFAIVIFLNNKYMTYIILIGVHIAFNYYSSYYNKFWGRYNWIIFYPMRPIRNTYKLGLVGFFLSSIKIINKLKVTKKVLLLFILALLSLILYINSSIKGHLYIIFSTFLIVVFAAIPFEKTNIFIFNFIKQITSHTGGIYYTHGYINDLLNTYVWSKYLTKKRYTCTKHYFACYLICFIGTKLFSKTNLKYLFN